MPLLGYAVQWAVTSGQFAVGSCQSFYLPTENWPLLTFFICQLKTAHCQLFSFANCQLTSIPSSEV